MKTKKASLLTKLVVLALLIGAATGLLAVPRLGATRIAAGVAELQREGLVTTFEAWQQKGALHAPPERLAEAWKTAMIPTGRPTSPAASWAW